MTSLIQYQQDFALFPGVVDEATDATNENRLQQHFPLSTMKAVTVVAAVVRNAGLPLSDNGPTIIKVANAAWNATPTSSITLTLPTGSATLAKVTGEIALGINEDLYFYIAANAYGKAGSHENVLVAVEFLPESGVASPTAGLLAADVISEARRIVGDTVATYREDNTQFLKWVELAQIFLLKQRSEYRRDATTGVWLLEDPAVTTLNQYLVVPVSCLLGLAYLVTMHYVMSLDADKLNLALIDMYFKRGCAELGIVL